MTIPSFLLGAIIASLIGALFHLLVGGGPGRILLYILLSGIGFWAGHFIAERIGWTFISVGAIHVGMAFVGSLLVMGIGYFLSLFKPLTPQKK